MRKQQQQTAVRRETGALAISIIWLLIAQFGCVLAWDQGFLSRQSALVHWLIVGVLPPALALWSMGRPEDSE
jgi:hypothetical protein